MIGRFYRPSFSRRCTLAFSAFLAIYAGFFFWHQHLNTALVALPHLLGGVFFLTFGTGVSLTLLLQWSLKKTFDFWEFVSVSLLNSLLFPPLILQAEFFLSGTLHSWYPLANTIALWGIAGTLLFRNRTSIPFHAFDKASFSLKHPLVLVFLFGVVFTFIQVQSFQPLPDLDPYKWLFKYSYQFANQMLDSSERPLFGSFTYLATTLMGISILDFFKYALPFLFLLTLSPAWMVARTLPEKRGRWLFLLFVFTSPNVLLYVGTAMPQAPLITISYFFVFFLLYSAIKQDEFFLLFAGTSMLLAFWYHEAALLAFLSWLIPVAIAKRAKILSHKTALFLLFVVVIFNASRLQPIYTFAAHWTENIASHFFKNSVFNPLYPARYSNIDHNSMGWDSLDGVMRFYAFYVGPLLGIVLLGFAWLLLQRKFRAFVLEQVKNNVAFVVPIFSFAIFFTIAEVFPRFPGIALLPDRSWIFCGVFSYVFLYLLLRYVKKISFAGTALFLLLFIVGISGALFINYFKRYLISPMQLESAHWIESSLPKNRIFLSYGYRNLLAVYADTPVVNIPSDLYCRTDDSEFQKILSLNHPSIIINPLSLSPKISAPIPNANIFAVDHISSFDARPLYIYYSRLNLKNPYRGRPYGMLSWGTEPCPDGTLLFDRHPEKFKRIYSRKDPSDEVVIWKILPDPEEPSRIGD